MFEAQEVIAQRANSIFWQSFITYLDLGIRQITWVNNNKATLWFEPSTPFSKRLIAATIVENWGNATPVVNTVGDTTTVTFSFPAGYAKVWDASTLEVVAEGDFIGNDVSFPAVAGSYIVAGADANGAVETGVINTNE